MARCMRSLKISHFLLEEPGRGSHDPSRWKRTSWPSLLDLELADETGARGCTSDPGSGAGMVLDAPAALLASAIDRAARAAVCRRGPGARTLHHARDRHPGNPGALHRTGGRPN